MMKATGRGIADGGIARQQADHEGGDAHQRHGDEEGVFAADQVAEAAEHQRAERAHRETGGKAEQHEDEFRGVIGAGHEGGGDVGGKRARQVEIVPFEDGAGGGGDDDLPLLRVMGAVFPTGPAVVTDMVASLPHC